MKSKRSTIYDVASEAGVSITTVSRYLNNAESVKSTTGEKISRAMDHLDYIPQGNAGSRASRMVRRIGVLTPFFPAPSFVERLEGMISVFKQSNHEVIIYTIENVEQLDEYLTSVPFMRRIDGLILMSVVLTPDQHRNLIASKLDVVLVESDDENYSRVLADDYRGGVVAAELFLKKNYLPCAYMGDVNEDIPYSCNPSQIRLQGFSETLKAGGYTLRDSEILYSDTTVDDAVRVFTEYHRKNGPLRAVFAMSDLQAIGLIKAARALNLRVPEDLAILGFDDIESADWMGLSTISQHLKESGRIAASLLLENMSRDTPAIQKTNLQVSLYERETT